MLLVGLAGLTSEWPLCTCRPHPILPCCAHAKGRIASMASWMQGPHSAHSTHTHTATLAHTRARTHASIRVCTSTMSSHACAPTQEPAVGGIAILKVLPTGVAQAYQQAAVRGGMGWGVLPSKPGRHAASCDGLRRCSQEKETNRCHAPVGLEGSWGAGGRERRRRRGKRGNRKDENSEGREHPNLPPLLTSALFSAYAMERVRGV